MRATKLVRSRPSGERGAVAIEFAIILPVLATLMLGIIQYGYYFFATQSASSAAREAARRLVVGDCQATGSAQSFARNQAMLSSLTLVYGDATSNTMNNVLPDVGRVLRVKVTASGDILGYLPMPDGGSITRTVDALVEDKRSEGTCP